MTQKEAIRLDKTLCPGLSTREDAIRYLQTTVGLWQMFCLLPEEFREDLIGYCMGLNGLAITYDAVFKKIFNPETRTERVESLLSALLGRKVSIRTVLPLLGTALVEKGSFLVMDMLVELDDGTYADLEMQKVGYKFPVERSDCYGADLIMRQYTRLQREKRDRRPFDFKQMKKIFCIVLMEQSSREFIEATQAANTSRQEYIHGRWMRVDTGIMPDSKGLHEDIFVCLDLFRKNVHNIDKNSSLTDAWLTFLSATDVETITQLIEAFPEFLDIYKEIAEFVRKPEELTMMLSEELYIMDRNTEREMRKDMEKENKALELRNNILKVENEGLKDENEGLKEKNAELIGANQELIQRIKLLEDQLAVQYHNQQ